MIDRLFGNPQASHRYEIEVEEGRDIVVFANNRTQATAIAEKNGFTVRLVNMTG